MHRIVVTGGAGFLGSAVIRYLMVNISAVILNVDKLTYAGNSFFLKQEKDYSKAVDSHRYQFLKIDITDQAVITTAINDFKPGAICTLPPSRMLTAR